MSNQSSTHFVIRVEQGIPEIIGAYDDYNAAYDAWKVNDDSRIADGIRMDQMWYAVRQADSVDGLIRLAIENAKLTPKQRTALIQIHHHLAGSWRRSVRPGLDRSWHGMYSGDLLTAAKPLAKKGLVVIDGVSYGPKTYRISDRGIALAKAYKAIGYTGKSNWDREARRHVYA